MNKIIMVAVGLALAGVGVNANALTNSGNLTPSLTISAACTISVSSFAFPNASVNTAAGTVVSGVIGQVLIGGCASWVGYWLGANGGTHYVAGVRYLANGVNMIPYTLDLGGSGSVTNWGTYKWIGAPMPVSNPTVASQAALLKFLSSGPGVYTVTGHATLPVGVVAGTYTDTVIVMAEF